MAPHNGLVHREQLKWQESNFEFVNSSIDHRVKYNSATTEPAWNTGSIGTAPGLHIWRIESFQVIPWPLPKYSSFHTGDSYIILHTQKVRRRNAPPSEPEKLIHDIFFWLGAETSQDEAGTAAYKTVELDEFLHGAATQHRETQTSPSSAFLSLFPRLFILRGGVASGFRTVEKEDPADAPLTLLRVFTVRGSVLAEEVSPEISSLDSGDCFVLDAHNKIWVWQGKDASSMEKAKAALVAADIKEAKHLETEVVGESEFQAKKILEVLGGDDSAQTAPHKAPRGILAHRESDRPDMRSLRLLRLSDASGQVDFLVVKEGQVLGWRDLDGRDVFVVDTGSELWVWQGQGASAGEKALWLRAAQAYLRKYRPSGLGGPIGKVVEGYESLEFVSVIDQVHTSM